MNRKFSVVFMLIFAVLIFGIHSSASEPWFRYDQDAAQTVIVSLYKARINEDYSVTIVVQVTNGGNSLVENFSINKASIIFENASFSLDNQIVNKKIKPGSTKNYAIKIPSKGVPEQFGENDLKKCTYSFDYCYASGSYWHTVSTNSMTESYMYN